MTAEQSAGGARKPETDIDLANRLMRFYAVDGLYALISAQNRHVERLQAQLPRPSLGDAVFNRVREG